MLIRIAALTLLMGAGAVANPPELGDPLPADAVPEKANGKAVSEMIDSAQLSPGYKITRDEVTYVIALDENQKIIFIRPDAPSTFKTPEGIAIGVSFMIAFNITHKPVMVRPGWAYYFPLPSGWNAALIADPKDPTSGTIPGNARISFLFKSKWAK